jgi:uncharacterized protein YndB with AHSA1/START domain
MEKWWPLESHSLGGDECERCVFEPFTGGAVYEVHRDGSTLPWGRVVEYAPPSRLVLSWYPGREESTGQTLVIDFVERGNETEIILEHSGWERLGDSAAEMRRRYDTGWDEVFLRRFGGKTV